MPYIVDFNTVSTVGLESSPIAAALAGLRANEARYFKNKYDHVFTVEPAGDAGTAIDWVHRILKEERDIVISSRPLEATAFQVENIRMAYVFYQSGLSVNVMYTIDAPGKRAVGFKLSEGMEVPAELASRFKFARGRSRSWPEPFAVPTSPSRTSIEPELPLTTRRDKPRSTYARCLDLELHAASSRTTRYRWRRSDGSPLRCLHSESGCRRSRPRLQRAPAAQSWRDRYGRDARPARTAPDRHTSAS